MSLDGETEKEGGDFAENDFVTFGDCECAELTIEVDLGEASESEVWQALMIDDDGLQVEVWSRSNFSKDWSPTTTLECLDANVCYVFFLEGVFGDVMNGNLRLVFDGEELYDGGWDGNGGFVEVGDC